MDNACTEKITTKETLSLYQQLTANGNFDSVTNYSNCTKNRSKNSNCSRFMTVEVLEIAELY